MSTSPWSLAVNAKIKRVPNFGVGSVSGNTWQRGERAGRGAVRVRGVMLVPTLLCLRSSGAFLQSSPGGGHRHNKGAASG